MLAAALRRHRGDRAFHDLQQRLLHALARYVAGDRGVVRFAADLIDLVDIDDAALRPLDIVVGGLQQLQDDVFDVLADIAGFGQRRGVGHGEGNVDDPGQRLGQQRLAAAGRTDQQDVRLRQLDVVVFGAVRKALVMIVDRDGKHPLGVILPDHVVVEDGVDIARRGHAIPRLHQRGLVLFADDVHAQFDAFIADEHSRAGNQLADLMLALSAEGAVEGILRIAAGGLGHMGSVTAPSDVWSGRRSINRGKKAVPNAFRNRMSRVNPAAAAENQPIPHWDNPIQQHVIHGDQYLVGVITPGSSWRDQAGFQLVRSRARSIARDSSDGSIPPRRSGRSSWLPPAT